MCEADAKCKEAYIPALVDAALALFDNGPLPYTYTDPSDPSLTINGEVTVDDMVGLIYGQQGDRFICAMSLPATLSAHCGRGRTRCRAAGRHESQQPAGQPHRLPPMAILMHMAMVCSSADPANRWTR